MPNKKARKTTPKENRRKKQKYAELDPKYALKTRADLLDHDYLDKLSDKELEWLNKFDKEYISGSLDRKNRRKNLHKTKKLIKDCDDRNNARNRDILTRAKASNQLSDYETLIEQPSDNNEEDKLIKQLDQKEIYKAIEWLADESEQDLALLEKKLTILKEEKD